MKMPERTFHAIDCPCTTCRPAMPGEGPSIWSCSPRTGLLCCAIAGVAILSNLILFA